MKTKAVVLEALGLAGPYAETRPLQVVELELDAPGAGELLVRVEAAGICHSDLSVIDGSRPRPVPLALGHEAAGVVEAVGPGVRDVVEGDHVVLTFVPSCGVCGECSGGRPALCPAAAASNAAGSLLYGGRRLHRAGADVHHHLGVSAFSERVVVARGSAVVLPRDVPFEIAALFGCAVLTGAGAVLETAGLRAGESAAVFGLGGVGLSAVMGAAVAGASPIIGVDPVASKRALALELGATAVFAPDDAEAGIADLTSGGARYTFETAGRAAAFEAAYRSTARGGTTVAVGLPDPSATVALPLAALVGDGRTIIGSYMGSTVPQRDIPRLLALWAAGRLPVERLHTATIGLDELNEGMDALASGEAVRQIVVPRAH
ncbi:MAG: zinc-binding dehydrogenase [Gaiellales bacterium]